MQRSCLFALVLFTACGTDDGGTYVGPPIPQAIVVSGDFATTGLMSKLDLSTMEVQQNVGGTGAVAGDPVLRRLDDQLYVVNRSGGNNVTIFDATTLAFVDQLATGEGSNPQDVARVGDNLYLPAMGTAGVVKIDSKGTASVIDLSMVGDPDGKPDCVSAVAVDSKVYVSCGLLDENYMARGNGVVAVIDTGTDTVTKTVALPTPNPYNFMIATPGDSMFKGDILIPMLPSFTDYSTGCVARLTTGSSPAASCVSGLSNSQIGGTVIHMDLAADGKKLWMAVGTLDADFKNPTGTLKSFDGAVAALSPSTQTIQDVAACADGSVIAVDGTFTGAGLRVYANGAERTSAALAFGLPPTFGNAVVCYGGK